MSEDLGPQAPTSSVNEWKRLFDAALLEEDPRLFPERLQDAKDAIVDQIENSYETASSTDRLLLLAALNTISGLFETHKLQRHPIARPLGHSA